MNPQGPIVCATDLSAGGARATDLAARVARDLDVPLRLVHATDLGADTEPRAGTAPAQRTLAARVEDRTAQLSELLDAERARVASIAPTTTALIDGRPWSAVVEDASRVDAQMIVVGPHGQSGPAQIVRPAALEWLLGITADRVVRHAPCPVLVAPHTGELPAFAAGRWVIGLDFDAPSGDALELALALAPKVGASLTAVHVAPRASVPLPHVPRMGEDPVGIDPIVRDEAALRARAEERIAHARAERESAPPVDVRVAHGDPATALIDLANEQRATLIVIGTHGRRGAAHALLGSVAERVLRRAHQPVLCVRPRG